MDTRIFEMAAQVSSSMDLYPVSCMDCSEVYSISTIPGSTGLCDECLEESH